MMSEDHFNSWRPESLAASPELIVILQAKELSLRGDEGKQAAVRRETKSISFSFFYDEIAAELIQS